MVRDEGLQLGDQRLCALGSGRGAPDGAETGKNVHQIVGALLRLPGRDVFLLKLLPCRSFAPLLLGLRCVFFDLTGIKFGKVHRKHSCLLNFPGVGNELLQMFPLHFQQVHLLGEGGHRVKIRGIQNPLDVLQRELQLPEKQDRLHPLQRRVVIQPVARFRHRGWLQQADGVIMVERAHTHASDTADFPDGFHFHPSR